MKYLMVRLSDAIPERDVEYESWYEKEHIPDLIELSGVMSGQLFRLIPDEAASATGARRYVTLLEIETDDLESFNESLRTRMASQVIPKLSANVVRATYEPVTPRVESED